VEEDYAWRVVVGEMEDYETYAEVTWKGVERKGSLENDNSSKDLGFYFHPSGPEFLHSTQHSELQEQESVMIKL